MPLSLIELVLWEVEPANIQETNGLSALRPLSGTDCLMAVTQYMFCVVWLSQLNKPCGYWLPDANYFSNICQLASPVQ